ncbi:16S rRNA (cytidine(1402)-2'-O)-methyltransferase [bacterium]|nr:16S rRNA (cytidine(1402)-2'-O)-methyltransferase [bacterium]
MTREFDFYVVPTPIGNISDITLRAIETLKNVDFIACEDTRTTQKLLNHYNIKTKCISYHKFNEKERIEFFLRELNSGKKIALVSDAGTPLICDPGEIIIEELTKNGFSVTSLPGACAVSTFLSHIPRKGDEYTFIGFMPRKEEQIKELAKKHLLNNLVFYESPERIMKTLKIISIIRPNAQIAIGRELSKLFEEVVYDSISSVLERFKEGIKGEIVCMIYAEDENPLMKDFEFKVKELKNKGFKDKEISTILSTLYNVNKNKIYQIALNTEL